MNFWLILANLILSPYCAGSTWTMQLMHYPIYAKIGRAEFVNYIEGNNKRAIAPTIIAGVVIVFVSLAVAFTTDYAKPVAIIGAIASVGIAASSGKWQGRIHLALAHDGYSIDRIQKLVTTNWVRTIPYTVALIAATIVMAATLRSLRKVQVAPTPDQP
jgi:hypothetical protein